jgi:hypothetical protein
MGVRLAGVDRGLGAECAADARLASPATAQGFHEGKMHSALRKFLMLRCRNLFRMA